MQVQFLSPAPKNDRCCLSFFVSIAIAMVYHQPLRLDIIAAGVYHQPQVASLSQ
ncbi:MAG: hypothetical protein IKA74_07775 [Clostridia bacterium]|nr:hypothetical protein [Clostridia bacterium]